MLNKVVFSIDVFSECEQSAIMQFVKIHNGKFDNNLVGSKYTINGLINSIFTGIKDTNPNTTAIKEIQIVNSHVLLRLFRFFIF